MASRKTSNSARSSANIKPLKRAPKATPVRNSAVPKPVVAEPRPRSGSVRSAEVTFEMVQRRAYEISQSPMCGSEFDNWVRAERELRGA